MNSNGKSTIKHKQKNIINYQLNANHNTNYNVVTNENNNTQCNN